MSEIFGAYLIINIISNIIWWVGNAEDAIIYGLCFCNPKWIYNHHIRYNIHWDNQNQRSKA